MLIKESCFPTLTCIGIVEKECNLKTPVYHPVNKYNHVEDTSVSLTIKKPNARNRH